jgi:hypothetical protein
MSNETFSREYLLGLPEKWKLEVIQERIKDTVETVKKVARSGMTVYMWDIKSIRLQGESWPLLPVITNDDYVAALKEKFPDCSVSYQEHWVPTSPFTRELQKGIVIDWS